MIAIIDCGMGNLRSVQKAFEYVGFVAQITMIPPASPGRAMWCCRAWEPSATPWPASGSPG